MVGQNKNDTVVFWGCFIALITTAFGFITRMFLIGDWETEFGLDKAQAGRLAGMGIWPFAVSIIAFSLFIDKIGYKTAMFFAFFGHIVWAICGFTAYLISSGGDGDPEKAKTAFNLLYWGSLVMALGNGTVEAFINPVVATMFSKQKTKWLNILHAGWPGGLVIAGIIVIFMGNIPWGFKVVTIAVPAVVYLLLLSPRQFPVSERVSSGVSYRDMLAEFGILGALIVGFLVTLQLMDFFSNGSTVELSSLQKTIFIGIGVAIVVGFGLYTRAIGRPLMFVLVLIMMPLATTEIGTDGWITGIMEGVFKMSPDEVANAGGIDKVLVINGTPYKIHPGWVLVYTSVIMVILRFFAGPIVHKLSPLGLLAISAVLAIVGLYTLSFTAGVAIFLAATLYGIGKTFFWPTMLAVVGDRFPRSGAVAMSIIGGIGMMSAGLVGSPGLGYAKDRFTGDAIRARDAQVFAEYKAETPSKFLFFAEATGLDGKKLGDLQAKLEESRKSLDPSQDPKVAMEALSDNERTVYESSIVGDRKTLVSDSFIPGTMAVIYLLLLFYFMSIGGYRPVHIAADFTGGTEGPMEA